MRGKRGSDATDAALPMYEARPPEWLPKSHLSADLGYLGFDPPRPGQDEDVLSKANVKEGFSFGHPVSAETYSAQDDVSRHFAQGTALTDLEDLMNQIFARRVDDLPAISPSSFRMPSRVTLNDTKRLMWFADLANPEVPLHKLGKSVPHGAKGHDLLDLLQTNNVSIPRAVWFLRVFGSNETAGVRNRPTYNPTQYSVDWANVVTGYLKKQLTEIALPSAPRLGLNIKQTFKGVLSDPDSRDRWISRFVYSVNLLRTFYAEGLVDNRTILVWLAQQLSTCNLAQASFVARLAEEYLDDVLVCRALAHSFLEACLLKLSDIRATPTQELGHLSTKLVHCVQRACLVAPDAFVSPRMWTQHQILLTDILDGRRVPDVADAVLGRSVTIIKDTLSAHLADIKHRNEALLFLNLPVQGQSRLGSAVSDIQLLNAISATSSLDSLTFFDSGTNMEDSVWFARKLEMLLSWSVTSRQFGDHRTYAAATLLGGWCAHAQARASRRESVPPHEFLQDRLFDWLDASEFAADVANISAVAALFERLVQHELFSYELYVQRLIARGEPGLAYTSDNGTPSRHRPFLRWIPLFSASAPLVNQRKAVLYGPRARATPEEANERAIRGEIRALLPELFGGEPRPGPESVKAALEACATFTDAPRYEQVRTLVQWLVPIVRKYVTSWVQVTPNDAVQLRHIYATSLCLMEHAKYFESILDISINVLEAATASEVVLAVTETFRRHMDVWTCLGAKAKIISALEDAHRSWRTRGVQARPLMTFLLEIDDSRFLTEAVREQLNLDVVTLKHALAPVEERPDPVPPVLPEILLLAQDPNPEAPSILANALWYKYRTSSDWPWKVWDNTVASLRQIPVMVADGAGRHACAAHYAAFLMHIDEHLPDGIDAQVLHWFLGPGKNEIAALTAEVWDVLTIVLLYLCVHGALTLPTVFVGLVYPAWQAAAKVEREKQAHAMELQVAASTRVFALLLQRDEPGLDGAPPVSLFELQRLHTRRRDIYRRDQFALLLEQLPALAAIENSALFSEDLRATAREVRKNISLSSSFQREVYRDLNYVRGIIEDACDPASSGDGPEDARLDALRAILSAEGDDGVTSLNLLSCPWTLGVAGITMQVTIKQSRNTSTGALDESLDRLTAKFVHNRLSAEEAEFVANMVNTTDTAVASKFVDCGLRCIADILRRDRSDREQGHWSAVDGHASEVLRLLVRIIEPLRKRGTPLPAIDPAVQDHFILALYDEMHLLASHLRIAEQSLSFDTADAVTFLARLLQLDLGLSGAWSSKMKDVCDKLCSAVFELVTLHGAGRHHDPVIFPLLVDSYYYLLDELPVDPKISDAFRGYPVVNMAELPTDMPREYRAQIRFLLPFTKPNTATENLVHGSRDAAGAIILGQPVHNRPWEWTEHLGDHLAQDPKEEEKEREERDRSKVRHIVKNTGSLSLELFEAHMTTDGIVEHTGRLESTIRQFEDGLESDSVFQRDWREMRLDASESLVVRGKGEDGEDGSIILNMPRPGLGRADAYVGSRGVSPASSVLSRASLQQPSGAPSTSSARLSPSQASHSRRSVSTAASNDEIEGLLRDPNVASGSRRASKRKAQPSQEDDDEIQIIDPPLSATSTRATKRPKTKTSVKGKASKR